MSNDPSSWDQASRRQFIGGTVSAVASAAVVSGLGRPARAASPNEVLKVGLIGCGGRGSGAALQALQADPNTRLTALGDAFEDRLEKAHEQLQKSESIGARVDVPKERRFVGFDAYKAVIDSGVDVVLLATPPHFRPIHLKAAVAAGRHAFAEKPVAVDAPGVRSVIESCKEAKAKNLAVVSGLCFRYDTPFRDAIKRIHEGALGEVKILSLTDFRGGIWVKPRKPGMTDMEWQMRNWYYFSWLSGDFNVEQHVHQLDLGAWILKDEYPTRAFGTGGRAWRTGPEYGNIFDHHAITYEYANGARLFTNNRQYQGSHNTTMIEVIGTKGTAHLSDGKWEITSGKKTWEWQGERKDKYQNEHDELFASIRKGRPINNGDFMSKSTLMGIMGRMASYTGRAIAWDAAMTSTEDLSPPKYDWAVKLPVAPIPVPGANV